MAWASLVVLAGPAVADALDTWSPNPRTLASLLLWAGWAAILLTTLVPRPAGLTVLRAGAPLATVLAVAAAFSAGAGPAVAAVASTALVCALAFHPSVGSRFVNGPAYGNERRFPLRVPPALLLGPLPLAVVLLGAGATAGPLLLADGRAVPGALALLAGGPLVFALGRSLYALSQRWVVLVPAGLVLKDPLTLVDPVLFPKDRIASLRPLPYPSAPAEDILDLRLGAVPGSVLLELTDDAMIFRTRGRMRGGEMVQVRRLAFSPSRAEALLQEALRRKTAAAG